jgi:hypothetical protein
MTWGKFAGTYTICCKQPTLYRHMLVLNQLHRHSERSITRQLLSQRYFVSNWITLKIVNIPSTSYIFIQTWTYWPQDSLYTNKNSLICHWLADLTYLTCSTVILATLVHWLRRHTCEYKTMLWIIYFHICTPQIVILVLETLYVTAVGFLLSDLIRIK